MSCAPDHAAIKAELAKIAEAGIINPRDVVEFARNPKTALHSRFEWDDTEAGHQWRLHQARNMLRVYVEVLPNAEEVTRGYVSLTTERVAGGDYRAMVDVLSDATLYQQLLDDALTQLHNMKARYGRLKELQAVWASVENVERKRTRRKAA